MQNTTKIYGTIEIKLFKLNQNFKEFTEFQKQHYEQRLHHEKQTPVHLRCDKQWQAISYLRKRVNEFKGIFFNPKSY